MVTGRTRDTDMAGDEIQVTCGTCGTDTIMRTSEIDGVPVCHECIAAENQRVPVTDREDDR